MPDPGPLRPLCPGSTTIVAPGGIPNGPGRPAVDEAGGGPTGDATGDGVGGGTGDGAAAGALPGPAQLQSTATRVATSAARDGLGRVGTPEMVPPGTDPGGDPSRSCRGPSVHLPEGHRARRARSAVAAPSTASTPSPP